MSLGLNETNNNEVEAAYLSLRIIWLAMLTSVVTLFVVTLLVQPSASKAPVIFWILMMLGFITFGASFVMKYRLLKQAAEKQNPGMVRTAYIAAFALCDATGVFGTIAYFATGVEYYYFFFVLSGFGTLLHKPQRDDLLATVGGKL
ncbi:MAG TPA: hypothetical protein VKB86_08590 [Pyrinomonadaceae bacterium]|nr:hypothetical protein [Pyrinomonadaceae bacterium]